MAKLISVSAIDVAACQLWLDASDLTTLFQTQNSSIAFPVTANNDFVGCWVDKSGKGLQLSAANLFRPIYKESAAFNGLPAIEFNGLNMYLGCSAEPGFFTINNGVGGPGFTVFIACQRTGGAGNAMLTTFSHITGTTLDRHESPTTSLDNIPQLISTPISTTLSYYIRRSISNTVNTLNPSVEDVIFNRINQDRTHIVTYGSDNAQSLRLFVGGNYQLTAGTTTGVTTNTLVKHIRVGGNVDSNTAPSYDYQGFIHEIIVFNRYLNTEERKLIEAYLGEKWGAPYQTYCVQNGDINNPAVYFNETVPTLTSAWVIPNGFNITISADKFLPRLTTRTDYYTNQYTDTGSFIVTQSCSLTSEQIIQQTRAGYGGTESASVIDGRSPTMIITPGVTLNLNTDTIASQHRGAPVIVVPFASSTTTLNLTRNNVKLYGYANSAALSGNNVNFNANGVTVRSGRFWNSPRTASGRGIILSNSTINIANGNFSTGVNPLREGDFFGSDTQKLYALNCTGLFTNCIFGGERGTQSTEGGSGCFFVNCNSVTNAITLSGCTVTNTLLSDHDSYWAITFNNTNAQVLNTTINGGAQGSSEIGRQYQVGIQTDNGGNHSFINCNFNGGFGSGGYNSTTGNYDNTDAWSPGVRYNSGNGLIENSTIKGNTQGGYGTGVTLNGGTLQVNNCTIEGTNSANGIVRRGGTLKVSSNILDGPGGVRGIFTDAMFVDPVPRNSFIRYASDGTGTGFNAYLFHYTIDSLSAFSMPPQSAVRLGVPYAALTQVGQAIIPPVSAVSYGTLVDNTTGTAILTLELLNTFFQTPLSALTTPGTIGYRVANSLTSNQSVGHLIASFTTN